ncbi:MAG: shikimate dehydrogenase [Bacteroidetes bacterium]|nr:shikimate dehydrogenase [Bacteroidota bacterium]
MRKFGLIGYPLSHSFSQKYFTEKFDRENIHDCSYRNFSIPSIEELWSVLKAEPELEGLNVTIPYKEQVIPFLNFRNEVVEQIHACNCIKIVDGKLFGFNTDVVGFETSLKKKLKPQHNKALILGTGGASKAVEFVMRKLGIDYKLVSRKPSSGNILAYADLNDDITRSHTLIVNTSPVGMYPNVDAYPEINYNAISSYHYLFDLIYNPAKTAFLEKGEERGAVIENGLEMLVLQAEESWRIWNEK